MIHGNKKPWLSASSCLIIYSQSNYNTNSSRLQERWWAGVPSLFHHAHACVCRLAQARQDYLQRYARPGQSSIILICKQRLYINPSTSWHIITCSKGSRRSIRLLACRGLCILFKKGESLAEIIKQLFPGRMNCCEPELERPGLINPLREHNSLIALQPVLWYLSIYQTGPLRTSRSWSSEWEEL